MKVHTGDSIQVFTV